MRRVLAVGIVLAVGNACLAADAGPSPAAGGDGLLFYLSGEKQFSADVARGPGGGEPTVVRNVSVIADGAKGSAFQCAGTQVMAYWAPGNIYAQRGTLSFFWRARDAVGPTEFPIFRVAYSDSSTWDMAWLRIDYNGHGFDAFVTDANLARTRVSVTVDPFPKENVWTHIALAWDETKGIRFFVNGKLAAEKQATAVFDTGLDQFGPHSRIISPHQVQSDYNFIRGGDIDEVRIYDRMLADENIAQLARGDAAGPLSPLPVRSLADAATEAEWSHRYGWDKGAPPALPDGPVASIRKVEIHDAYDLKRWWWKATDGIRETTWPGVYNRSRLPGRWDYFTLPDWDCYALSGKAITFVMPDEPWNHMEMSGSAWGKMELMGPDAPSEVGTNDPQIPGEAILFERAKGADKTVNRVATQRGGKIRFTNVEQEEPIGELSVYNVTAGAEPAGSTKREFTISNRTPTGAGAGDILSFIQGRYLPDERATVTAVPAGGAPSGSAGASAAAAALPVVHVVIPDTWDDVDGGLDGIAIDLPAMHLAANADGQVGMNIRVKDPLWAARDMLDFTFSSKPDQPHTLWLDLRDRLLPKERAFYLTVASSAQNFSAASLEGAKIRLVFKPREAARAEHELDRFTQARDSYAMLVEEHPKSPRLNLWVRFETDLTDLLRVNPDHVLGRQYAWAAGIQGAARPPYTPTPVPDGVPGWAFRQVELLGRIQHFTDFYIDDRQAADGELGGGLSDDTDLSNTWPGVALMGIEPEKIRESLRRELQACYDNKMFTNGMPTIQVDELHSYEEGINCLSQNLIADFGNPLQIERAMATQKGMERITGINPAGHRLFRTAYYSATKMAEEYPWGYTKGYSYLVLQPGQLLVDYNGNPEGKQVLLEMADGLLAHRHVDANGRGSTAEVIDFKTDKEEGAGRRYFPWHVFWTAYTWTGDRKYLDPIMDGGAASLSAVNANTLDWLDLRKTWNTLGGGGGRGAGRGGAGGAGGGGHVGYQLSGDKKILENLYASQTQTCDQMNFINTEGSLWIDRVSVPTTDIQRARLGGVALIRNSLFPGHTVSWDFHAPDTGLSVAILIPDATRTSFKVIAYNLEQHAVTAAMTGWNVDPGTWEMTQGVDGDNDDVADGAPAAKDVKFERSASVDITFPPRATTVLTFKLKTPGTPYWKRPDLAIGRDDVIVDNSTLQVTVHNLGSVDAPAARIRLIDGAGKEIASAETPALKGVTDLTPVHASVSLRVPAGVSPIGGMLEIVTPPGVEEITALNNRVEVAGPQK